MPKYTHTCPDCIFLGEWEPTTKEEKRDYLEHYDLYWDTRWSIVTVRYSDKPMSETHMEPALYTLPEVDYIPFSEGLRLAIEQGYYTQPA